MESMCDQRQNVLILISWVHIDIADFCRSRMFGGFQMVGVLAFCQITYCKSMDGKNLMALIAKLDL